MPSIDDEEETLCLLSAEQEDSPGPRQPGPCGGSVASYNQITPSAAWDDDSSSVTPVTGEKPLVMFKSDDMGSKANSSDGFLAAGNAERTFFNVCGTNASAKRHYIGSDGLDTASKRHYGDSDALETLTNHHYIENDANDSTGKCHYSGGDSHDCSSKHRYEPVSNFDASDAQDDEDDESDEEGAQRKHLINDKDSPNCVRASIKVVNEILTDIEDDADFRPNQVDAETDLSASTSTSRSLVVDVHLPPDHMLRPYKHEINRFQRCYSDGSQSSPKRKGMMVIATSAAQPQNESLQRSSMTKTSLENDSFQNVDKIETICETDPNGQLKQKRENRFRHSSECAGFGSLPFETGLRGFNFHEEFLNFRQNLFEGRPLFFGAATDNASKRKSDSDVLGKDASSVLVDYDGGAGSASKDHAQGSSGSVATSGKKTLRLNSAFSSFPSAALANSSVIVAPATSSNTNNVENDKKSKKKSSNSAPSPYTFFTMESDDDFDFDDIDKNFDQFEEHPRFSTDFEDHKSTISQSSSTVSMPVCRICQLPSMEPNNHLISPCRCLGSIRYVHNNCLLKWLEVSSKRRNGPASCELCQYQYLRHKKFVISHWRFPECSLKDKILHFFFVISVCLMIACAAVTIICFKEDRGPYRSPNKYHAGELSPPEMITLSCGVLFFLAFFLAMYVEVKARHTVYQLICKFFYLNHEWSVEEYDRKRDLVTTKKKKEKVKKKEAATEQQQNSS